MKGNALLETHGTAAGDHSTNQHYFKSHTLGLVRMLVTSYLEQLADRELHRTRQSEQVTQSNNMLTFSRYACLIALIAIQAICANFAYSYEQGSYFVFDIIGSAELEPAKGRLAIPAEALTKAETKRAATGQAERSEFEIDFKQAIQPKGKGSGFRSDSQAKMKPFTRTTSPKVEAFDFGTSGSVFGK